jgi:hypothetical protein
MMASVKRARYSFTWANVTAGSYSYAFQKNL